MLGRADLRDLKITAPTRILVDDADYATPIAVAEALHAATPGSQYAVIAGGRRLTPLEFPNRIAAALTEIIPETAK